MKYTILGFSQKKLIEFGLNIDHAILLRYFIDFRDTRSDKKMKAVIRNNKSYYWLKYEGIIEQLPILNIKKDTIYKKLKELVDAKVLEHETIYPGVGSYSYYRTGENYEILLSKKDSENNPTRKIIQPDSENNPTRLGQKPEPYNKSINNKSINNNYLKKDNIGNSKKNPCINSSNSLLSKNDLSTYEISAPILSILKDMKKLGKFRNSISENGKQPTKIILTCIKYLKWIKSGIFSREVQLEKGWKKKYIEKWTSVKGYSTWREVKNIVIDSLERFVFDVSENRKAGGSLWSPKDMNQFFFNCPFGNLDGKSMFLKYINIKPKTPGETVAEWQRNHIPEVVKNMLTDYFNECLNFEDNWALQFWSCMNRLCTWHKENNDRLIEYNKAYNDNAWGYHCGDIGNFFKSFVIPYLSNEMGPVPPRPIPIDRHNGYWQRFHGWMLNSFGIEMEIDVTKEKGIGTVMEQRIKDKEDQKLGDMIEKVKLDIEAEGFNATYEQIRTAAVKRLEDE